MARVMYTSTLEPDMRYFVPTMVPDGFFFVENEKGRFVIVDAREFGILEEVLKDSNIRVDAFEPLFERAQERPDGATPLEKYALQVFETYGLMKEEVSVPTHFPLHFADVLRAAGATLIPEVHFVPERLRKNEEETALIADALKKNLHAYECIERILKESVIEGESVLYKGEILTSEVMQKEVGKALFEQGLMSPQGMIIASGPQSAIPHHHGEGPIKPHVPIICDIYPQDMHTSFFADMTRTYVKGEPSEEFKKMYNTVLEAQEIALALLKPGFPNKDVHQACVDHFNENGYLTKPGEHGFIHSTGHAIGLDIHESPVLSARTDEILEEGNMLTIEPGLYYPEVGGVRIEDAVVITKDGHKNLTNYKKKLEDMVIE